MSEEPEATDVLLTERETPFLVAALDAVLDGAVGEARDAIAAAALVSGWASLAHRLDVAGRALVLEVGADDLGALPEAVGERCPEGAARELLDAWSRGGGMSVELDLTTGDLDVRPDIERTWPAVVVLAHLVDLAGFPPEVIV